MTAKLGSSTAKFRLGYGAPASVQLGSGAVWEPSGEVVITTTAPNGTDVVLYAESSTGSVKVIWWDNTSEVKTDDPSYQHVFTKGSTSSAAKTIRVFSTDAGGTPSGTLRLVVASDGYSQATAVDVSECRSLEEVYLYGNPGPASVTIGQMPNLGTIDIAAGAVRIDKASLPALQGVTLAKLTGSSFDASNWPTLAILVFNSCGNLQSFNIENTPSLTTLTVFDCDSITAIDFSGRGAAGLGAYGCASLTSIRAVGTSLDYGYNFGPNMLYGSAFLNNNLGAEALNQFFSDLDPTETGILIVYGNPGSATCDPTIATAKGYIVVTE